MNKKSVIYKLLGRGFRSVRNLFSQYGLIRNYIIFPIGAFLRTRHVGCFYSNCKRIESLKNVHKGKKCFILATGPSMRVEDAEKLENEITIALNSFYRMYDNTSFRPTYYATLDPDVQNRLFEDCHFGINELAKEYVFLNSMCRYSDIESKIMYLPINYLDHWFNVCNPKYEHSKNLKYTEDLLWGIYDKFTITNAAIDIAIYMGCDEIYLLGVDCNYSGPSIYFFPTTTDKLKPDEIQAMYIQKAMMAGYRFMESETKARGIRIYNATRGGMLEEFERINFDDIVFDKEK